MKFVKGILSIAVCSASAYGQGGTGVHDGPIVSLPKIMVVPYVDQNQPDVGRALLDPVKRLAISIAEEELRELQPLSFAETYKLMKQDNAFAAGDNDEASAKQDPRDAVAQRAGADIRVELDLTASNVSGSGFKVSQVIKAIDPYTGQQLAIASIESDYFSFNDTAKIARQSLGQKVVQFKNDMQASFTKISQEGRPIRLNIIIDNSSPLTFMTEMNADGDELQDVIVDFLKSTAFKRQMRSPETGKNTIRISDFRIPLRDESGDPYYVNDFSKSFRKFLKKNKVACEIYNKAGGLDVVIK